MAREPQEIRESIDRENPGRGFKGLEVCNFSNSLSARIRGRETD